MLVANNKIAWLWFYSHKSEHTEGFVLNGKVVAKVSATGPDGNGNCSVQPVPVTSHESVSTQTNLMSYVTSGMSTICYPTWENRAYVHKIHPFTLFYLFHLLYKI